MILYDTIVKVKRLKTTSGNARALVATATGDASIQPIAKEPNAIADGQFGTLYVAYVEIDLPARKGDTLTDPDGTAYVVKDVIPRDNSPFPYKELTLKRQ
jgi:hypothetical protein